MANVDSTGDIGGDWLNPSPGESGLQRYMSTLRQRGWLIVATVLLALLGAVVFVKSATPVYQAQGSLLVTPVSNNSTVPSNIPGLIYASADPTRDIQTAANVISSVKIAGSVKIALRLSGSPTSILSRISVQPVSNSNILAITAQSSTAAGAASLANAFAKATIASRTAQFRATVAQQIAGLKTQSASTGQRSSSSGGSAASLPQQLAELQILEAGSLPDISISALAVPPSGRTSPRVTLSLGAGLIVGLVLGILGILGLEAFDSTLRREDQLRALFRLPILARIPRDRRLRLLRRTTMPRTPETLATPTLESFRTLRAVVLASRSPGQPVPRTLMVTSAAPNEGKTTTALNLATSLAAFGESVILIEGDLRRPAIGNALGLASPYDVTNVVTGEVLLEQALVSSKRYPNVRFLLAEGLRSRSTFGGDALFLPTVSQMLQEAERLADFVVIDSPPLLAVIDALELARRADSVLIVAQLGRTDLRRLAALGALLAEAHIVPTGITLIGAQLPGGGSISDYQYQMGAREAGKNSRGRRSGRPTEVAATIQNPRHRPAVVREIARRLCVTD